VTTIDVSAKPATQVLSEVEESEQGLTLLELLEQQAEDARAQISDPDDEDDDAAEVYLKLPIPYKKLPNRMIAYYGIPTRKQRKDLAARTQQRGTGSEGKAIEALADVLVTACVGIYARNVATGRLEAVTRPNGTPMKFDEHLAKVVGASGDDAKSATRILIAAYSRNDIAILGHVEDYQTWAKNPTREGSDPFGLA
jgi:hypothetical protein